MELLLDFRNWRQCAFERAEDQEQTAAGAGVPECRRVAESNKPRRYALLGWLKAAAWLQVRPAAPVCGKVA